MLVLENKNRIHKQKLIDKLFEIKYSKSGKYCELAVRRACASKILDEDDTEFISVKNPPTCFLFKVVRGDVWDNWKILVIPALILTVLFANISVLLTTVFGVASLCVVLFWFVEDWWNTLKS